MYSIRFERTIEKMKEEGLNQLIVTSAPDLFYYLGKWIHSGERMVALYINSNGEKKLILNEIIMNPKAFSDSDVKVVPYKDGQEPLDMLVAMIDGAQVLGIDKNWPSHFLISLMEQCAGLKVVDSAKVVDMVRIKKGEDEVEKLATVSAIVDKVMEDFIKILPQGFSEAEGEEKLLELFKKHGSPEFSFDPILAYGANAANPHHMNSSATPKKGDCVIIDIGGRTDDYCSDTTRTVFLGEPCEEAKKIYELVRTANEAAIAKVKPGVTLGEVDAAARNVISEAGYGEYFTHRTGHGIGIEVHELPSVSAGNEMKLEVGMSFSIEPGIYMEGKYGVRIEDIVVVTEDGCRVLNSYPKTMQIIG